MLAARVLKSAVDECIHEARAAFEKANDAKARADRYRDMARDSGDMGDAGNARREWVRARAAAAAAEWAYGEAKKIVGGGAFVDAAHAYKVGAELAADLADQAANEAVRLVLAKGPQ